MSKEDKNKVWDSSKKKDYLKLLDEKYILRNPVKEQFEEAKNIPERNKENWTYSKSGSLGGTFFGTSGVGHTEYISVNYEKNKVEVVKVIEGDIGQGAPFDAGGSLSLGWYPEINSFNEFGTNVFLRGGSINPQLISKNIPNPLGLTLGGNIISNSSDNKVIGIQLSVGKSFKNYDLHIKNTVFTRILSREEYTIYDYYQKFYPRGGRNSWKLK